MTHARTSTGSPAEKPEENIPIAIGLRLLATALFATMSLSVRLASVEAPVGQIVFFRSAVALVPIVIYLWWRSEMAAALKTRRPIGHLRRSLFGGSAMFFSFLSIANLPLSLATALSFLAPLIVVPAAILFLREKPTALVVGATIAGFAGVALMLWPSFSGPSLDRDTLVGIGAGIMTAVTTAAAKVEIKTLTATEEPAAIAFYFALFCALAGLATALFGWATPSTAALVALIASGVFGGLAHIAMTEGIARAPASTLAPFEYTAMLWSLVFDAAIFALLPGPLSLAGALLIVAAAACVAFQDRIAVALRRWRRA